MSETNYFRQGGRKIEIRKDNVAITPHAENEAEARNATAQAGVVLDVADIPPDELLYSAESIPALRPLLSRVIQGTWQLHLRDTFRLNVGRLTAVSTPVFRNRLLTRAVQ